MKDLIITINANTRKAKVSKTFAGITGENLQGNIIFDFVGEFIDGTGYLDFDNGQKYSVQMTKEENRYTAPIHNSLLQKIGKVKIQLRIEQTTEQTTVAIFKSRIIELPVFEALDPSEMPVDYAKLGEKTITENGTYNASDDGLDGYSKVVVDIQGQYYNAIYTKVTITTTGSYQFIIADFPFEPKVILFDNNSLSNNVGNGVYAGSLVDGGNNSSFGWLSGGWSKYGQPSIVNYDPTTKVLTISGTSSRPFARATYHIMLSDKTI